MIFGATGYTGRAVVSLLCERGVDTIAHIRPDSSRLAEWSDRFQAMGARVDTTPWDEAQMATTLAREAADLLFYLIGTTRARDRKSDADEGYDAIDYGLLKLLVDACQNESAKVEPRIVYLSAIGVRENRRSSYYRARWNAEQALRESGLPYLIARPAIITGSNRDETRVMERIGGSLANLASRGLRVLGAKELADRYRSMSNVELAAALVDHALDGKGENRIVEAQDLKIR